MGESDLLTLRDLLKLLGAPHTKRHTSALRKRLQRAERKRAIVILTPAPYRTTLDLLRAYEPALFAKIDNSVEKRLVSRILKTLAEVKSGR